MADILHELTIKATPERVYRMFSKPEELDKWWTKTSSGNPRVGEEYKLGFGPGYDWHGTVTRAEANARFEFRMHDSDPDWDDTCVGCAIEPDGAAGSRVWFYHTDWPEQNEHWRVSCYCWAMYLRILRRYLEHGEIVPYEKRLDA